MQSAQIVTLKSGPQNASGIDSKSVDSKSIDSKSVDSKSPMHSFDLRTSSTLPRCTRVTSNPEVEPQKRDGQNQASGLEAFMRWAVVSLPTEAEPPATLP